MNELDSEKSTQKLIDELMRVLNTYGLATDSAGYEIVTQIFLYKFLNDTFIKSSKNTLSIENNIQLYEKLEEINEAEEKELFIKNGPEVPRFKLQHTIHSLLKNTNDDKFFELLDETLNEISLMNSEIFSASQSEGEQIKLFEYNISSAVESSKKNKLAKALIEKLVDYDFSKDIDKGFDFFSIVFEYLIEPFNAKDGGDYAEYYTPNKVSKLMSEILVGTSSPKSVTCYDPSAGSGTLLMNLASVIGQSNCTIFAEDITQKGTKLLRLNLILNKLASSLKNIINTNTLSEPGFTAPDGSLQKFDFIISNPPFRYDFSDFQPVLKSRENSKRFFCGIPDIPKKDKKKMKIFVPFLQHMIYRLNENGKGSVVVPTGFLSSNEKIEKCIKKYLIDNNFISGVITPPQNIFANTPTSVSIIFIDKNKKNDKVFMIDAQDLGYDAKDGRGKKKRFLTSEDVEKIKTSAFNLTQEKEFSIPVSTEEIQDKEFSLVPAQYFPFDFFDLDKEEIEKTSIEVKKLHKKINKNLEIDNEAIQKLKNLFNF